MLEFLLVAALTVGFSTLAAWAARRVLGTHIGWLRAIVVGIVILWIAMPVVVLALQESDVLEGVRVVASQPIALLFAAVALGWLFAIDIMAILLLELLWPSGGGFHPIRAVRDALRRRDRVRRYGQILRIAGRHGLRQAARRKDGADRDVPAAVVAAMNEAGVTFVKIGQVLSTRDDVLPREFTDALATLQMQTTPLPWSEARAAIEAELGRPIDEVFAWIDETPLAAASVAQVHVARLADRPDGTAGEEVVVKIQRPAARASVQTDIDIIERLADEAERHFGWARGYGVRALAAEFARALREELDYRVEVGNTELLRDTIARSGTPDIVVPRIHTRLCTSRMIVQERVVGTPLSHLDGALPAEVVTAVEMRDAGAVPAPEALADAILDSVFEQIAVRGIFHADLHPGNILLREDGRVALIDFGAIGVIERSLRRLLLALLLAMAADDDTTTTDVVLLMVAPPAPGTELDRAALQHDIGVILTRVHNGRADSAVFRELLEVLRAHELAVPPALLLVFRTIASLEGSLRHLAPGYDIVGKALARAPHFAGLAVDRRQLATQLQAQGIALAEQVRRLPRRLETLGSTLERGELTVRVRSFAEPEERSWVAGLVGQLTTTVVGVALIVVAIVLLVDGGGPLLTPDVGVFPFLGSLIGLGGLLLVLRTLRQALARRGR